MRPYATWKYVLLIVVLLLGSLYAAPNLFGEQPAVQISLESGDPVSAELGDRVHKILEEAKQVPLSDGVADKGKWVVRFGDEETQLRASDALRNDLGNDYVVA